MDRLGGMHVVEIRGIYSLSRSIEDCYYIHTEHLPYKVLAVIDFTEFP